ncbi:MAG: GTPase HflX [Candidatus Omnitrophica bacterium]|nr:GTPase HflX [Candidatus Omnitrophota bacterium]
MKTATIITQALPERALAVTIRFWNHAYRDPWPEEESARELKELISSCGLQVVREHTVKSEDPHPGHLIGTGKAQEIHQICHDHHLNVVILSENLSAAQQGNLEDLVGVKVIDRTQLILDVFAQRATSQEGKVQVELAQLEYLLPRLAGKGVLLSRLGGGIGTRGPGEQKLEMDRRRIRQRINRLKKELQMIHRRRWTARRKREEEDVPTAALIGYTNAGKSTLLNRLTDAGAVAENRLFSTLDPLARRLILPNHQAVLLSDTVGFIHRIPHDLIESFKATLEEVTESHLLIHVIDSSHPVMEQQMEAVEEVLKELQADRKPRLLVFNKIDRISRESQRQTQKRYPEGIFISAASGEGVQVIVDRLCSSLSHRMRQAKILLPGESRHWLEKVYEHGVVLSRHETDKGLQLEARIPLRLYGQMEKAGLLK